MNTILLAIILGAAFGFALNRVGATNPQNIINMLRLTDLHLAKVILFAIGFASFLLFLGIAVGFINPDHLSVKASHLGVVLGGLVLGVGFAVAGYCPGTGLAAAATGRIDAIVFVIGGLIGAFAYTLGYEAIAAAGLLDNWFGGKVTFAVSGNGKFPALLGYVPGIVVAGVLAVALMSIAALLPPSIAPRNLLPHRPTDTASMGQ